MWHAFHTAGSDAVLGSGLRQERRTSRNMKACSCEDELELCCERACTGQIRCSCCTRNYLCTSADRIGCFGIEMAGFRQVVFIFDLVLLFMAFALSCVLLIFDDPFGIFGLEKNRTLMTSIGAWAMIQGKPIPYPAVPGLEVNVMFFTTLWGLIVVPTQGSADSEIFVVEICHENPGRHALCNGVSWGFLAERWNAYETGGNFTSHNGISQPATAESLPSMGGFTFGDFAAHSCTLSAQTARISLAVGCGCSLLLLLSRFTCHSRFERNSDSGRKCPLLLVALAMLAISLATPLYYWEGCLREIDLSLGRLGSQSGSAFAVRRQLPACLSRKPWP